MQKTPRTGFHWISFSEKPDDATRGKMHASGWSWNRQRQGWYHANDKAKIPVEVEERSYSEMTLPMPEPRKRRRFGIHQEVRIDVENGM